MSVKKRTLTKILLAIIIALFFIFSNTLFKKYLLLLQNDSISRTQKVENKLKIKEQIANKNLFILIKNYKKDSLNIWLDIDKLTKLYDDEKISFFIYSNDSLVFWSRNTFPITSFKPNKISDSLIKQLSNGWYEIILKKEYNHIFIAAILVKSEYKYENDYLINEFDKGLNISTKNAKIVKENKVNAIKNLEGKPLFSIIYKDTNKYSKNTETIIFFNYLVVFLTLLYLIFLFCRIIIPNSSQKNIRNFLFFFIIILFRLILFYFRVPKDLYDSQFFSPVYFASSELIPSFGDLLINTIILFIVAVILNKGIAFSLQKIKSNWVRFFTSFYLLLFSGIFFCFINNLLRSIILDSTISYNLNQIFTLNGLSIIGFFIISFINLSYFLIAIFILKYVMLFCKKEPSFILAVFLAVLTIILIHPYGSSLDVHVLLGFLLFNTIYFLYRRRKRKVYNFYEISLYLILFTYITYYTLNTCNTFKEIEKRKSLAQKISSGEDPLAEYLYNNIQQEISNDIIVKQKLSRNTIKDNEISDYIIKKYFSGYWEKYKIQITVCNNNDSLLIEPFLEKKNCYMYFDDLIKTIGKNSSCENLYSLNDGSGGNNYISRMEFIDSLYSNSIFVELNSKFIPKGLGYPELLIDKKLFINTDLSNYSYAKYLKNTLIDAYGKYYFPSEFFLKDSLNENDSYVFEKNGYSHLVYNLDNLSFIIISKKTGNLLDTLAPFSLLFSLFCITLFLFLIINNPPSKIVSFRYDFKNRLQISIISIIFISFIIIGVSTYFLIRGLNENKNVDILSEKAMSILIELQGNLSDNDTLSFDQKNALSNRLARLSNIFFTDINIFDKQGDLLSSSRPQIFNEGLISKKMNAVAFQKMITDRTTLFIQKENIGKLDYFSAYIPLYNRNGKIWYYINLPYFAKESELKKELSAFLMAFINIYVLLVAITVLITLFVAGRITQPLNIIRDKISAVKLGSKNEKIKWPRRDEIGSLISEYNRMIDELSKSADMLARSERENAWREMAMQVAHEIKNPLTPMKLSVQYLDKAWKEKAPDWDNRLERFTKNIVEQIDSLSAIASEFSYFAKMPKPFNEILNIIDVIKNSIEIFKSNSDIRISTIYDLTIDLKIFADKNQIIRVMNNLLNNSFQAINLNKDGVIEIDINSTETKVIVCVKDNGEGISEEMKEKIFIPNFSTKSEGMGLGLAIVSSIIENCNGRIWFKSEKGVGTTFFIELPRFRDESNL
ncbi:MAG: HAMP domain-containing sensor histidine kinase [Bacteroidota bacterium]